MSKKISAYTAALKHGYKSGLEDTVAKQIESLGLSPNYEKVVIGYSIPESNHTYKVDFFLSKVPLSADKRLLFKDKRTIVIETKGRFMLIDRKKSILVRNQYPNLDLRFVFTNSKAKISKTSKTSYADWCTKEGFKFADKLIPMDWIEEIRNEEK